MDSKHSCESEMEVDPEKDEKASENIEAGRVQEKHGLHDEKSLSESILRSVIQGSTSPEELQKAVRALALKAQDVKTQIYASICKEYSQFFSTVGTSSNQNERLQDLLKEKAIISQQLELELTSGLNKTTSAYKELKREYVLTENIAETLKRLYQVQSSLEQLPKAIEIQDFSSAALCINDINEHFTSLSAGTCEAKVFKAVREEFRTQKAMLLCRLEEHWDKLIKWKIPTSISWSKIETHLNSSLSSQGDDTGKGIPGSFLYAMHLLGILDTRLKTFGKKLLTYLLKPVIIFPSLTPVVDGSKISLQRVAGKGKQTNVTEIVFPKMITILQHVGKLLSQSVEDNSEKVNLNPLKRIGVCLWSELSDLIITECLAKAVPVSGSQLDSYNQTIENTIKFEQCLQEMGFIPEDTHDLLLYVKDVNTYFANRKCQDLLQEARRLMTSDIHYMTKFERQKDRSIIPVQPVPDVSEKMAPELKRLLLGLTEIPKELFGAKIFLFPECHISESAKKLMDMVYKALVEATESHEAVALQIFYAVRNIFDLYTHVVPTYHKENLKLPQIAALHYNNSMYLAHHCMTLGHQFFSYLPDALKKTGATFADLVPELRRIGRQFLLDQHKIQRGLLLDILRDCRGFADCCAPNRSDTIERSLKQIVHQLVHISKLWKDVLPENIYLKCLGLLFSSVLEEIISQIMQIENFSASEASLLHGHLNLLTTKAVDIFNPKSSEEDADMGFVAYIYSWQKYQELVYVLEASLQQLVDRWADGKGPLAEAFDSNEVRSLIRALFQNTDRRAQAIARIKQSKES